MGLLRQHCWYVAAAGITLAHAVVSLSAHRGPAIIAFGDFFVLLLMLGASGVMLANAFAAPRVERRFWGLMALGFFLWSFNQAAWTYREGILHLEIPDPYFADIVLFFHLVPILAAVSWRPDLERTESRFQLSTVNFLMLLVWWIFLYAFVVVPDQYVVLNPHAYDSSYEGLYHLEKVLLLAVLGFATWNSSGGWRRLYAHVLGANLLYAACSYALDQAINTGRYYSGSAYDIPLVGAIAWMAAASLAAREWQLASEPPATKWRWGGIAPRLAMLAILSLPALGLWTFLFDTSPPASRTFRLFAVLIAMLALGAFVFLRQYLQDQALMQILEDSRQAYEDQQRLQNHLVQKEKLASLGHLVAGAAHEIDHPLCAIMAHSETLWTSQRLTEEQSSMVRKIVHQAQRTRDLVENLLSFAQQTHGERSAVDLGTLLQRGAQMLEAKHRSSRIKVSVALEPGLPRVAGNANQLFQAFYEIMENAMDAMAEVGGGSLTVSALQFQGDAVLQFSDTGPGMREPERVFDPFYTTKPVGKGTGLGLSAAYGVVQDHGGQITCQNKSEGGALFILRLPAATPEAVLVAEAAKA
ncbi:MAG TPA: HAMP domain-containing sensor histidine kinase [Candidatus Sulfotelmatobacter sp.]|nr:HAMP domain-containing sensor histidine kinase [Candidatus Sulfotelmatobacter sp.]